MAITRKIYTAGVAKIYWTKDSDGITQRYADGALVMPLTSLVVQSLDWSKDVPKETITAFGTKDFARIPSEATSVELEMELYPVPGIGNAIKNLAYETLNQTPDRVNIWTSAGHCVHALMSSFEFEASVGDVPTMSLSFQGQLDTAGQALSIVSPSTSLASLVNVGTTSTLIAGLRGGVGNAYANPSTGNATAATFNTVFPQSCSVSWDGAVETISRLADSINTVYAFGNPPGEASIECEGLATPGAVQYLYLYSKNDASGDSSGGGSIGVLFTGGKGDISSESVSNAVGELFQTFSTTTEGTAEGVTIGMP